jgi:hypothetical protein
MANKSNTAKIRAYIAANPDVKPADVAAKFNTKVTYVYVLRSQMRKQVHKVTPTGRKFKWADVVTAVKKNEAEAWQPPELLPVPEAPKIADMVNHPAHYKTGGIETIDFIEAKGLNYRLGNVVKYVTRADHKGDRLENLKKAQWYLEREIAQSV